MVGTISTSTVQGINRGGHFPKSFYRPSSVSTVSFLISSPSFPPQNRCNSWSLLYYCNIILTRSPSVQKKLFQFGDFGSSSCAFTAFCSQNSKESSYVVAVKYTVWGGPKHFLFNFSLTMVVVNSLKIALLCLSSIGASSISSSSVQEPEIHVRGLRNHVAVASQTEEGENIDINHRVSTYYYFHMCVNMTLI